MKIIFFDSKKETRTSVDNVEQIVSDYAHINGRVTKVWHLYLFDGSKRAFKQKDYTIDRIEA